MPMIGRLCRGPTSSRWFQENWYHGLIGTWSSAMNRVWVLSLVSNLGDGCRVQWIKKSAVKLVVIPERVILRSWRKFYCLISWMIRKFRKLFALLLPIFEITIFASSFWYSTNQPLFTMLQLINMFPWWAQSKKPSRITSSELIMLLRQLAKMVMISTDKGVNPQA